MPKRFAQAAWLLQHMTQQSWSSFSIAMFVTTTMLLSATQPGNARSLSTAHLGVHGMQGKHQPCQECLCPVAGAAWKLPQLRLCLPHQQLLPHVVCAFAGLLCWPGAVHSGWMFKCHLCGCCTATFQHCKQVLTQGQHQHARQRMHEHTQQVERKGVQACNA